jgi:pimeloyl-ACP methyl ester carboxylesterase
MRSSRRLGFGTAVRHALRSLATGDEPAAIKPLIGRPIVLLHGFAASSRVLLPLERHLRRRLRRPVVRVYLGGRTALHLGDIRGSARRVHAALASMAEAPGFEYADVVGHSMGGLVATYLLKRLDRGRCIRQVVTLGTPHRGTLLAALGVVLFGVLSRAVWQMLPGAPLLRELDALPVPAGSWLLAVGALGDTIVPPELARVPDRPRQTNVVLDRVNHWELVESSAAFACVTGALDDRAWDASPTTRHAA